MNQPAPPHFTYDPSQTPKQSSNIVTISLVIIIVLALIITAISATYFITIRQVTPPPQPVTATPVPQSRNIPYVSEYFGYQLEYPSYLKIDKKKLPPYVTDQKVVEVVFNSEDAHYVNPDFVDQGHAIKVTIFFEDEAKKQKAIQFNESSEFSPIRDLSFIPNSLVITLQATVSGYLQITQDKGPIAVADIHMKEFSFPYLRRGEGIIQFTCMGQLSLCKPDLTKILSTMKLKVVGEPVPVREGIF